MICFLCNINIENGEKTYCMFDKRICEDDGKAYPSISVILETTFSRKFDQANIHSNMLCDKCTSLIYLYEEIQEEYLRLRYKIIETYNKTAKLYDIKLVGDENTEDQSGSKLINVFVTNISENILEISDSNKSETYEFAEEITCEQIIGDENIFCNNNFEETMKLQENETELNISFIDCEENHYQENNEVDKQMFSQNREISIRQQPKECLIKCFEKSPNKKIFNCDLCGATFAHRKNLSTHKRTLHLNGKIYKCNECDCCFSRKIHLECHIRSSHTGEKPFICNICNASFAYPHIYARHLKIHSDIKFSCEICGKKFNSRDNRNAHRFIHSEKKRYECFDCGLGFMQKSLLQNHIKNMGHKDIIMVNPPPINNK